MATSAIATQFSTDSFQSSVDIGSVSPRWHSQGSILPGNIFCIFIHSSLINTSKHVKDALYVILWFLYCLGFLSIEQILFVIYLSIYCLLSVLSVQDGAHRVPARPRFLLHVYLLFSHVSFINTLKNLKNALYVILWFLYCLGFLSIEQILFVIYLSIYLSIYHGGPYLTSWQ